MLGKYPADLFGLCLAKQNTLQDIYQRGEWVVGIENFNIYK